MAALRSTEWAMRWSHGVSEVFSREGTVTVSARVGGLTDQPSASSCSAEMRMSGH